MNTEMKNLNEEIEFYEKQIIEDCIKILETWDKKGYLMQNYVVTMKKELDIINKIKKEIKEITKNKGEK